MKSTNMNSRVVVLALLLAFSFMLVLGFMTVSFAGGQDGSKYVGVKKCKNCHNAESKGDQYGKWAKMKHSKAYETLASDKAKEVAEKLGVKDPQKDDKCLKCHETAFGKKDKLDKSFKAQMGVQCESCHGPGGFHVKTRLADAAGDDEDDVFGSEEADEERKVLPKGEMTAKVEEKACTGCHSKESPTFKDFDFSERSEKIKHSDPRKK